MGRAAIEVDVPAVRRIADYLDVEAQLAKEPRRDGGGGAIGGVVLTLISRGL